jgi:hypothetical protein
LYITKICTRLEGGSDKVYQLLAHVRWSSPGTPASSTTKTGRHDIAEILLKVALKHQKSKKSNLINILTYKVVIIYQLLDPHLMQHTQNVKNIFLSMCDVKVFLTFASLGMVLL